MQFHFDEKKASDAIKFIRNLKHTQGSQFRGQYFNILDWQRVLLEEIFGWVDEDGYRKYRTAYVEIPKKNGKTELAAAVALKLLIADDEFGAEVYSAANDREQASKVYRAAERMVIQNKTLRKRLKCIPSQKRIVDHATGSFFHALSNDAPSKHGLNISGLVIDEIHSFKKRTLVDILMDGTGAARKQPLTFIITTAGIADKNSIGWIYHDLAEKIKGKIAGYENERFFPYIFGVNEKEDWHDEEVWRRVNPSIGITIDIEDLRDHHRIACQVPSKENDFRRLRLNQWVSQITRFIPMDIWKQNGTAVNLTKGRKCWGAMDLASNRDLAAFALVFQPGEDGMFDVTCFFFIPEDNVRERVEKDKVPYDVWIRQGLIQTTPGDTIDYDFIMKKLEDVRQFYDMDELAYDRWGMAKFSTDIQNKAVMPNEKLVPMGQGFASMSPPTKELLTLLLQKRIRHGNHPILEWMASNMAIKMDPAENVKPDKSKSTERIDGMVALIMALDRAIRHGADKTPQIFVWSNG